MEKIDKVGMYIEKAKDMASEAGEAVKLATGDLFGTAKEKVQGVVKDAKSVKEISLGLAELESLPAIEGSILYTMEIETLTNYLKSLQLVISDGRLNDESVVEEIKEVMDKVRAEADAQAGEAPADAAEPVAAEAEAAEFAVPEPEAAEPKEIEVLPYGVYDEEELLGKARSIVYSACERALAAMNA